MLSIIAESVFLFFCNAKVERIPIVVCAMFAHAAFQIWARGNVDVRKKPNMQQISKVIAPWLYSTISTMALFINIVLIVSYALPK